MMRDRFAYPAPSDWMFELSRQHIAELHDEAARDRDFRKSALDEATPSVAGALDDKGGDQSGGGWDRDVA